MVLGCLAILVMVPLQVPRPFAAEETRRELHEADRAIRRAELEGLERLADELARSGDAEGARAARSRIPVPEDPDGPTRFVAMPGVVPARPAASPTPVEQRIHVIRSRSASAFLDLARRAAKADPPRYALSDSCLRAVLDRQPDQPEARRLLGYVPYQGGWARPFDIAQFREGYIDHPVFGWVRADWKPNLERGELPSPTVRGQVRWLSVKDADQLREGWDPPWQIPTEHFLILSNVPLAEVISFGRRLEAFHDLFMAIMADVQGDLSPLARRFRDPKAVGEPPGKRHTVYYFSSREVYLDRLSAKYDREMLDLSLGFYDPPKSSNGRSPAYFFRDPGGQLPITANLYHEVSHQLLFESAGPNRYTQNAGNYWVFEGLGTYFETTEPQPDGSILVGGRVGRRMEEAIRSLVDHGRMIPLEIFVHHDESGFAHRDPDIYLRYQEAMALTVFLMQGRERTYREGFLDYVRDAYRGRLRARTGRKLPERLGISYETLEAQLLAFLRKNRGPDLATPAEPPRSAPSRSIRTVPRS